MRSRRQVQKARSEKKRFLFYFVYLVCLNLKVSKSRKSIPPHTSTTSTTARCRLGLFRLVILEELQQFGSNSLLLMLCLLFLCCQLPPLGHLFVEVDRRVIEALLGHNGVGPIKTRAGGDPMRRRKRISFWIVAAPGVDRNNCGP